MAMQAVRLAFDPGKLYLFTGSAIAPPRGPYRLIGCGRHVHSGQYLVAYEGLQGTGSDWGRLYFTTLSDWESHFALWEKPPDRASPVEVTATAAAAERLAGASGVSPGTAADAAS